MGKLVILIAVLILSGCGTKTIYISHGEPVQLRQKIKNVKVWVKDKDGNKVASVTTLEEGWYCLSYDELDQ